MPRQEVTVHTEDGDCAATLHTPPGGGAHPGVIVYADAAGVRETFRVLADRLAGLGYTVLLPDIYYRTPHAPFDVKTVFADPAERERLGTVAGTLTGEVIVRDAGAYLDFLGGRPEVSGTLVGTTGYCMGGRISLITAGSYPERVGAAASFHGGNLAATDDSHSPYLLADKMRAGVHVGAAENDGSFPPEQFERLQDAFVRAGVKHTIETYPAAHGFAVPDNPTFDEAAGERHWASLTALYAENLTS